MFPIITPPLRGKRSHEMKTTWERGRPARTRLAQLHLSPPLRSTRKGTVPGPLCKGCSRFVPHYHSPLEGESHEMKTTWERGRPARTRLAQLHLSPPLRSTRKGTVPGPLCKGCSRFIPHYHSPLEAEPHEMKTTWERGRPARTIPGAATPVSPTSINRRTTPFPDPCAKDVSGALPRSVT